jgi:hypothetical protein
MVREKIEGRRKAWAKEDGSQKIDQKLAALERKVNNYYDAIGEGLDRAICRQKIAGLEAQRKQLEQERAVLQREDYYATALEQNLENVRKFASAFTERFQDLPFPVQRQVVLHFVEGIRIVNQRTAEVHLRVPFENNGVTLLAEPAPSGPMGQTIVKSNSQSRPNWLPFVGAFRTLCVAPTTSLRLVLKQVGWLPTAGYPTRRAE